LPADEFKIFPAIGSIARAVVPVALGMKVSTLKTPLTQWIALRPILPQPTTIGMYCFSAPHYRNRTIVVDWHCDLVLCCSH
jgi:hypothetical protein